MKSIQSRRTTFTFLLAFLILFQSCTVYRKQPVSLQEAVHANTKARIEMANGRVAKYSNIEFENGNYYGVKRARFGFKKMDRIVLTEENILTLRLKDTKASNRLSFIVVGLPVVAWLTSGFWHIDSGDWLNLFN